MPGEDDPRVGHLPLQERAGTLEDRLDVGSFEAGGTRAREGEETFDDSVPPGNIPVDHFQMLPEWCRRVHVRQKKLHRSPHNGQHVAQLVGNSRGQLSHRCHLLGIASLLLLPPRLDGVADDVTDRLEELPILRGEGTYPLGQNQGHDAADDYVLRSQRDAQEGVDTGGPKCRCAHARAEAGIFPDEDRLTLCISSQLGCQQACRFCLTGLMGIRRNLHAAEIVGEVLALQDALAEGERISNLVLMGMGEPLLNFSEVERAIRILTDDLGANFSPRRITLSTAGHVPGIKKLAESDLGVNLAVSLSATTDAVRDQLMPINKRWPIAELLKACRDYPLPNRRRLTVEYVMLSGENDSDEDATRLVRLVRGIRCKINLIPFNATPDLPDRPSPRRRVEAFQKILHDAGLTATIRESRGQDISAACGMLRTEQDRDSTAKAPPKDRDATEMTDEGGGHDANPGTLT